MFKSMRPAHLYAFERSGRLWIETARPTVSCGYVGHKELQLPCIPLQAWYAWSGMLDASGPHHGYAHPEAKDCHATVVVPDDVYEPARVSVGNSNNWGEFYVRRGAAFWRGWTDKGGGNYWRHFAAPSGAEIPPEAREPSQEQIDAMFAADPAFLGYRFAEMGESARPIGIASAKMQHLAKYDISVLRSEPWTVRSIAQWCGVEPRVIESLIA